MVSHSHCRLLLVIVPGLLLLCQGRELQQASARLQAMHKRTTTLAEDEALSLAAAALDATTNDASATISTAAVAVAAVTPACVSPHFEWPASSGYCWKKRDSGGVQAGPGNNVFKSTNVAVNAQDQLVLTILNPSNKIAKSSCAEVFLNTTYGYGDYVFVVATNPINVDQRVTGAPFIYENDTREFDFEFTRWNIATNNNSQYVVQPYTTNKPVRFNITAADTTHRMRWTPEAISFESYYPNSMGGSLINSWTYTGANNFMPGAERLHINYWINTRVNAVPAQSTYVTHCFKFCQQANLASCSTPLGTKPSCSTTKTW